MNIKPIVKEIVGRASGIAYRVYVNGFDDRWEIEFEGEIGSIIPNELVWFEQLKTSGLIVAEHECGYHRGWRVKFSSNVCDIPEGLLKYIIELNKNEEGNRTMKNFIESTTTPKDMYKVFLNAHCGIQDNVDYTIYRKFGIEKVIFNDPATIVFWYDGSKTVVKCDEKDTFDREKGIALCVMKKVYGGNGKFNDILRRFVDEREDTI